MTNTTLTRAQIHSSARAALRRINIDAAAFHLARILSTVATSLLAFFLIAVALELAAFGVTAEDIPFLGFVLTFVFLHLTRGYSRRINLWRQQQIDALGLLPVRLSPYEPKLTGTSRPLDA